MDIRILVASRASCWMPRDPVYAPLRTGCAVSGPVADQPAASWPRDDSGSNISARNPTWRELTALYWAWKNLPYCDAVGLCRARRIFGRRIFSRSLDARRRAVLTGAEYARLLAEADIVVPEMRRYWTGTVRSHYQRAHVASDLAAAEEAVAELSPDYAEDFERILNRNTIHPRNMFVMRRDLFNQYCCWLFPLLMRIDSRISLAGRTDGQSRAIVFLAERLFNAWLEHWSSRGIRMAGVPVVRLEAETLTSKVSSFLGRSPDPRDA